MNVATPAKHSAAKHGAAKHSAAKRHVIKPTLIRAWSLAYGLDDPYAAPEVRGLALVGKLANGMRIKTSRIVRVANNGRTVRTETGGLYHAEGPPAPAYLKWLSKHNIPYDPEKPIRAMT